MLLFSFKLDRDWYILIEFGPKWDNGQIVIRKAHLSLRLRWAKKYPVIFQRYCNICNNVTCMHILSCRCKEEYWPPQNNDGVIFRRREMTPSSRKNWYFWRKWPTQGSVFCLLYVKNNDPRRKMTPGTLKKPLSTLIWYATESRCLDYVLCHSFLDGYRGALSIYLSWKSTNIFNTVLWRLAKSHRSLDNSFHRWNILFKVKNVSSGGFDPRPLALSSSVCSNVPCLRFHQYQPWLFIYMY